MKQTLLCAGILGLGLTLSGCGFTPLYGTQTENEIAAALRSVSLVGVSGPAVPVRAFETAIQDRLTRETNPRYELAVSLSDRRRAVAATQSAENTRINYTLRAELALTDLTTGEVRQQRIESTVGYGVVDSQYSSLIGREDAVRRAANDLARRIEFDLALFFSGRQETGGPIDAPERVDENTLRGGTRFETGEQ